MFRHLKLSLIAISASFLLLKTANAQYVTECPYYVKGVSYNDVLNIRA